MNAEATRYPLTWPATWPRTHAANRQRATFSKSVAETTTRRDELGRDVHQVKRRSLDLSTADAATRLEDQIARLGGTDAILSTNQRLRMDGRPKQNEGEPADVGAAVYFRLKGKPRCDKWDRVADNVAALAAHVESSYLPGMGFTRPAAACGMPVRDTLSGVTRVGAYRRAPTRCNLDL